MNVTRPWDLLNPGDLCLVDNGTTFLHVFAGEVDGKPTTYVEIGGRRIPWATCRPLTEKEHQQVKNP